MLQPPSAFQWCTVCNHLLQCQPGRRRGKGNCKRCVSQPRPAAAWARLLSRLRGRWVARRCTLYRLYAETSGTIGSKRNKPLGLPEIAFCRFQTTCNALTVLTSTHLPSPRHSFSARKKTVRFELPGIHASVFFFAGSVNWAHESRATLSEKQS